MLTIDGSTGEGGGQVLRSALALSLLGGKPFRIERIRAARSKPGLLRQHLTAVRAAQEVSGAEVEGAELGASELSFRPGTVRCGEYTWRIGSAGSTTLVLQSVLVPLLLARGRSTLVLEGGTHNPAAPPFDFFERVYLPLLRRMGARVEARLERPGFFPAGGGRIVVEVEGVEKLSPLVLRERGAFVSGTARGIVAGLPGEIAKRELSVVEQKLGWPKEALQLRTLDPERGPGNVLMLEVQSEQVMELFTGFGEMNVRAEVVAARAANEVKRYLGSTAAVGQHLADQLLLPMAAAGQGAFTTLPLTPHATTQVALLQQFLGTKVEVVQEAAGCVSVTVPSPSGGGKG
jgi:RNA 3'-terminal phosphate cyclase (ATP)